MPKLPSTSAVSAGATHQASRRSVTPRPCSWRSRTEGVMGIPIRFSPPPWSPSLPPPTSAGRPLLLESASLRGSAPAPSHPIYTARRSTSPTARTHPGATPRTAAGVSCPARWLAEEGAVARRVEHTGQADQPLAREACDLLRHPADHV